MIDDVVFVSKIAPNIYVSKYTFSVLTLGGQPGAQNSDSRVPFQLWPKMGGEGGPVPPAPGEPGGAVWKPFSCVLRPPAQGRPFSAVSSVVDERSTPP